MIKLIDICHLLKSIATMQNGLFILQVDQISTGMFGVLMQKCRCKIYKQTIHIVNMLYW